MDATPNASRPPLGVDEKVSQVMAYTDSFLYWGEVITKTVIRVSTWLRTNTAPDYISLYNGVALVLDGRDESNPVHFYEIHLPLAKVNGFHLLPPAKDPLDYDPNEANRKMEPVTVLVGHFKLDGCIRMAAISDLKKFLEVSRETWMGLYDVAVSHPAISHFKLSRIPYVLIRQAATTFARPAPPAG